MKLTKKTWIYRIIIIAVSIFLCLLTVHKIATKQTDGNIYKDLNNVLYLKQNLYNHQDSINQTYVIIKINGKKFKNQSDCKELIDKNKDSLDLTFLNLKIFFMSHGCIGHKNSFKYLL